MYKIFRSLTLISKSEFDSALYLCTSESETQVPLDKHMTLIMQCLKGEDQRMLPLDAFNQFYDILVHVNFMKWVSALKLGYILHYCLKENCKVFIEAVCCNKLFDKIKYHMTRCDSVTQIHSSIANQFYVYVKSRYEHYTYLTNALADFEGKEQSQQTLILMKIIQMVQLLTRFSKEIEISLEKCSQIPIMQSIASIMMKDLHEFYPLVTKFLKQHMPNILVIEVDASQKLYQLYTDTLRLNRPLQQMLKILKYCPDHQSVDLYQVDQTLNKQLELHFNNLQQLQKHREEQIIRFDDDVSMGDLESNSPPPKELLSSFKNLIHTNSERTINPMLQSQSTNLRYSSSFEISARVSRQNSTKSQFFKAFCNDDI